MRVIRIGCYLASMIISSTLLHLTQPQSDDGLQLKIILIGSLLLLIIETCILLGGDNANTR